MINHKNQAAMLGEYDQQVGLYRDLASTAGALLGRMLEGSGVQLHSITNRSKDRQSLAAKLGKPEKEYSQLTDVTDLAAVRVTTYFADDVDRVAEIVEREFLIDRANSIDKRMLLDPDRFGYQSLHYVAEISLERCRLVEYSRFKSRRFEIQVRSILQHAWAEIEHDLGYKSAAGVPREIRRRFSRIAGLLELADDEFSTIRRELDAYAATISSEIQKQPENVGIDKLSLGALISTKSSSIHRLSRAVAEIAGANLSPATDAELERGAAILEVVNVSTIADLETAAASHLPVVQAFAKQWIKGTRYPHLIETIGVLYLGYVLVAEQGDDLRIRAFIDGARLFGDIDKLVKRIKSTYQTAFQSVSSVTEE